MTSIAKLTIQGFTFGAALTAGGCMPQNQHELEQMRAEIAALKAEVASLKASEPAAPEVAKAPSAPQTAEAAAPEAGSSSTSVSTEEWTKAIEQHEKEKRDAAWARLREPALFSVAKEHINQYGASLNSVRCKETSCVVTINVPKAPKQAYEPMANPWAEVTMLAHAKPIYSGRTLWSYLLPRHEKDTTEAGADRVNPLELASKSPELVKDTVVVATSDAKPETGAPTASAAAGAGSPGTGVAAQKPAASPTTTTKSTASKSTASSQSAANTSTSPTKAAAATPQSANKTGSTTPVSARKASPNSAPAQAPNPTEPQAQPQNATAPEQPKATPEEKSPTPAQP